MTNHPSTVWVRSGLLRLVSLTLGVLVFSACSEGNGSPSEPSETTLADDESDGPARDSPVDRPAEEGDAPEEPSDAPEESSELTQDVLAEENPVDGDESQEPTSDSSLDGSVSDAGPLCEQYGSPTAIGTLTSDRVDEASGLAISRNHPGVMWIHNDSGSDPELFAFTLEGQLLGVVTLVEATSRDWEDLALGPCGESDCLYVGDIGNNSLAREDLALFRLVEPAVDARDPFDSLEVDQWERFHFVYPEGNHDAEALVVDPNGTPFILTKVEYGQSRFFQFPELTAESTLTLIDLGVVPVGTNRLSLATAADLDRTGTRFLVRTYPTAWEWRFSAEQSLASIISTEGTEVPVHFEIQGEAIAYDPIGEGYLHVSEGLNPTVYRVPCR